jgi:hypothetical protein
MFLVYLVGARVGSKELVFKYQGWSVTAPQAKVTSQNLFKTHLFAPPHPQFFFSILTLGDPDI